MGDTGDTNVDIAVRWTEAGQNIPAKVKTDLAGLKTAAGEAAPAIGDRMSQAFARLEAREPTMVLRRARLAMEELTVSAVGMTGPAGRLAASFAMLGGATLTGAIAGAAGLAIEFKDLLEFSGKLDKQLEALNTKFATLGGSMAVILRHSEELRQTEIEGPGFFMRMFARAGEGPGAGDQAEAIEEGMAAQMATLANARNLTDRQVAETRRQRDQQAAGRLIHHIAAEPTPKALQDLVARREDILKLGDESAKLWVKAFLDTVRQQDPQQQLRSLMAQRGLFEKLGGDALNEWRKGWLAASAAAAPGMTARAIVGGAEFARQTKPTELGPALTPLSTFDFRGPGEALLAAQRPFTAPAFGATFHPLTDRPFGSEKPGEAAERNAERNAEKMASVLGRELGPLIAAFSGGGARGAVAGLGGITGTLASLNDPKGKALLGSAAPYLSLASGVLSGISSLFGGGQKPKVIITAFEEQAARQIKELRGEPLTTSIIVIGATDMRQTQQALNRLARLGIIPRLP